MLDPVPCLSHDRLSREASHEARPSPCSIGEPVRVRFLFVVMALVVALSTQTAIAQARSVARAAQDHQQNRSRYPEIAKRYRIKGIVKLEVIVRKDGSVRSAKVLGEARC